MAHKKAGVYFFRAYKLGRSMNKPLVVYQSGRFLFIQEPVNNEEGD